ncbi:xylulokinase [Herpetosiphon sp. NSE202]|uniref:xylulokinase n=1 Tax=Herpetosiphon sp. NSE202 TaxID=3351349 RepID=UPI00363852AE
MAYVLGYDISTTATKALLIDQQGTVVAIGQATYDYATPRPLWSEQAPHLWWQACSESTQEVLAKAGVAANEIVAIGLAGQMHGLVLLDQAGEVLRPALLWNDQRTAEQCAQITERLGAQRLIELTGNRALTGFTAPKILWVQQHEPELYAQIAHILLPKDYVRYCMTGEFASDVADSAGTLLLDVRSRQWSAEVAQALEVDLAWLPRLFEGPSVTGQLHAEAAAALGLVAGIPVVGGGGDQAANAVGTGVVEAGSIALSLGTSGVVFGATASPIIEPEGRLHAFCHAVPGRWHLMGVMLSAAGSLRWYHDTFAPQLSYDQLLEPAENVAVGSAGLFFAPYLTGERTPHPDPLARGGFIGLTVRHSQAHLTRSVLEGVAFGLRDSLELMSQAGIGTIGAIRASGGGTRNRLWRQILADVLGAPLVGVSTTEGAAYGAALLAAVGAGWFNDVDQAVAATVRLSDPTEPSADQARYAELYATYRAIYPALQPLYPALAAAEA